MSSGPCVLSLVPFHKVSECSVGLLLDRGGRNPPRAFAAGKTDRQQQQQQHLILRSQKPAIDSFFCGSGGCGDSRGRRPRDTLGNASDRFSRNSHARRSSSCSRLLDRSRHRQAPTAVINQAGTNNNNNNTSAAAGGGRGAGASYDDQGSSSSSSSRCPSTTNLRYSTSTFFFPVRKFRLVRRALNCRRLRNCSAVATTEEDFDEDPHVVKKRCPEKIPSWLHSLTTRLLGALEEDQLKLLLPALETEGGDMGECVLMERNEIEVPAWGLHVGPHVLFMLYFRWKAFPHPPDPPPPLRRLACCSDGRRDRSSICVNPYHWTMTLFQDSSPPPPYNVQLTRSSSASLYADRFLDSSSICSMETAGSDQEFHGRGETPWCKILYWEGNERKGSVFPVLDPAINVLGDTPHGSGLSLAAFFGGPPRDERIRKTRRKICQGLVLWREGKVVWVYNRSEAPVYLNSASLDGSFFNLNLYKCPPGYAMIIYYYEMAHALMGLPDYKNKCLDKADVNSVRISFAKGWGKNYHRREILCCPCWIEVHVVPTLKVEQLTPPR